MSFLLKLILPALLLIYVKGDDYYELLGVNKDADNRDIRRAFKKLALKWHPDKNKDDETAHETFIKINKAYEVLKDEEMRKKYDLHGEEGLKDDFGKSWGGNYQSWNYYYDSFGIYDDDPEIITLSKSDFERTVLNSPDIWFINFYSPQCSHCHHLAPAWRAMARELEGVIRIGAVNCEEDFMLCREQNIHSYPSLLLYPQREYYRGSRETDSLVDHVLDILPDKVIMLTKHNFERKKLRDEYAGHPWLVFLCKVKQDCVSDDTIKKLAVILDGLINVASGDLRDDDSLCEYLNCNSIITYYDNVNNISKDKKGIDIDELEMKSILSQVLKLLPGPKEITPEKFEELQKTLKSETAQPWLIEFAKSIDSSDASQNTELKRLRAFLPSVHIGCIDCEKYKSLCSKWSLTKFPVFVAFKSGGSYEFHHGRFTAHDIATFVRESLASKVETLTPEDFPGVTVSNQSWFIDFFAPWCPPCMQLLPEFRKASHTVGHLVKFGTVDCTLHTSLCSKYNIRSYPTTILYNQTVPNQFHGSYSQKHLEDFVQDTLHPSVISLNAKTFEEFVVNKPRNEIWVIDFFAPWCSPCQQLSPEWRKLAKMMKEDSNIYVAQVDCTANSDVCRSQNVNSYPTMRLYPKGKKGASKFHFYNGWNRDAYSLQAWVFSYLPSKVLALGSFEFQDLLSDSEPWLVDFYAPWCGHCQTFAPEFEKVARATEGKVKTGKVNCEQLPDLCQSAGIRAYPTVLLYTGKTEKQKQDMYGEKISSQSFDGIMSILRNRLGIKIEGQRLHDEL